jgi:hypothetical protein
MENLDEKNTNVEKKDDVVVPSRTYTINVVTIGIVSTMLIAGAIYYHMKKESMAPFEPSQSIPANVEENEITPPFTIPIVSDSLDVIPDYPENSTVYEYPNLTKDTRDYSLYYKNAVIQEGVTWLPHPERFEPTRSPFTCDDTSHGCAQYGMDWEDQGIYKRNFFKIGTYLDKDILYTHSYLGDPGGTYQAFFLSNTNGTEYEFLVNHSAPIETDEYSFLRLDRTIVKESELVLNARILPEYITIAGVRFAIGSGRENFGEFGLDGMQFMEDTKYGPVFRSISPESSVLARNGNPQAGYVYFGMRLQGGLMAQLWRTISFMQADGVPNIAFTDGTKNTTRYRGQLGGCGSGSVPRVALEPILDSELEYVGRTSDGKKVYNLIDPNHPLITDVFEMTGGRYYVYEDGMNREITYTRDEFIQERGVLIYTDELGYQNILTNEKFGPQAECGKPVIYLYPETETEITVSVDATITKSEPVYVNGWTVIASPDGTLTHASGEYTSLFWDGYGHGNYPEINGGLIVRSVDALLTMESQLAEMGFTKREISDFSEFWKDHIPTKPYTRITWFFTNEMERLAKLTIDPKPDTLIRVFVDFEGLDAPIEISPQRLPAFERRGYSVVEWGGLLRKHVAE